jgi:hypothetical protein
MSAAEAAGVVAAEISEPLTWAEIRARYPHEWVCLVEVDYIHTNGPEVRTARVIGHGKTLGTSVEQAFLWRDHYDLIDFFYTGRNTGRLLPPRPRLIFDEETRDLLRYRR